LFPAVHLRLHRRDGNRELSGASRAVLMHLAQTGPMTIGECARHLGRAQSVVSEIVDQLERQGSWPGSATRLTAGVPWYG
jgi:DNA-binding MarR family transcriptional regulator